MCMIMYKTHISFHALDIARLCFSLAHSLHSVWTAQCRCNASAAGAANALHGETSFVAQMMSRTSDGQITSRAAMS